MYTKLNLVGNQEEQNLSNHVSAKKLNVTLKFRGNPIPSLSSSDRIRQLTALGVFSVRRSFPRLRHEELTET